MPLPEEKQNKERRQRILECAVDLFVEKGYSNTTVREVIAKSEIGTGTFYNYFSDKEDILKTLLEEFADQIISSVKNYYTKEKDLRKRFIETKRLNMEAFAQNEKLTEIYCRVAGVSDVIDNRLKHFEDRLIEFFTKNIEYGIKKGAFNDVSAVSVAYAILAVEKYLLYKWIVLKTIGKEEMIEMVVTIHEMMAQGLLKK
ncbi:MAG: TetR/AcrR family transcriptional regulator [Firmicutes bacterium]|nr:TetR/AcrR family transcriptional regulator [Bacillota bacterium]